MFHIDATNAIQTLSGFILAVACLYLVHGVASFNNAVSSKLDRNKKTGGWPLG